MIINETIRRFYTYVLLLLALCSIAAFVNIVNAHDEKSQIRAENDIIHIPTGLNITNNDLIGMLCHVSVVYIGETHDNYASHQIQLDIIKSLYRESSGNIAIGMEMFQKKSQEKLDSWISGQITEKEFLKEVWYPDWGFEYEYYREIIEFAKDNKIKIIALNANGSTVKMIGETGLDKLSDKEKKKLPEIDTTDKYHREHVKAVYDVHKRGSMGDFEDFYRVQCLWEETMAQSVVDYLETKSGKDKQVIVLAGKDHVRYGFGIPKRVFRRMRKSYSIVLPVELSIPKNKAHNIMNIEDVEIPLHEADFLWMTNYTDPVINRVRIGVMVLGSEKGVVAHIIEEGSPSEKIGMKKDDIIVEVDGVPIKDPFDLVYEIRNKVPGKSGKIKILREGQPQTLDIVYQLGNAEE
ncbi:MAG: ChaN family lipoprotein [Candidatus Anammoxibacter sp.]